MTCSNCGDGDARPLGFDPDLPTLVHCDMCALLIVVDQDMYDEVAGRPRGTTRART